MKKGLCIAALLAALLFALPALAQEGEKNLTLTAPGGMADYPRSVCFVGETLYALGGSALYRYAPGDAQAQVVAALSEGGAAGEQRVECIFANGDALMALSPESGQVYTLRGDALAFAFALPEGLLAMAEDAFSTREVLGAACEGEELFLLLGTDDWMDYGKTELFAVDLSTQAVRACAAEGARHLSPAAPGKLLLARMTDAYDTELVLYDIAEDREVGEPLRFSGEEYVGAVAWFEGEPVVLRYGRVARASEPDAALAYVSTAFASLDMAAACSESGRYAVGVAGKLCLRDLAGGAAARRTELVIGGMLDEMLISRFIEENPDIAVVQVENETAVRAALLSGDSRFDVLVLSAPGKFADYAGRGYLAEIDSEALGAWVDGLYPAIRNAVRRDGALLGAPIALSAQSWTVDTTLWEAEGLGEIPATYAQLLDFIDQWARERAQDAPEVTACDLAAGGVPGTVWALVQGYVLESETAGKKLTFDTPAFREALNAIADRQELLEQQSLSGDWSMPLLACYNQGFGISYNDDHRMKMILPPAVGEGERVMGAQLYVLAISAGSAHAEEARRLIEWFTGNLSDTARYQMDPSLMEPIERETYAERVAQLREELEELKARLEEARTEEELAALQEEIARHERMLESNEQTRYTLSRESIAIYREAAAHLRIAWDSVLAVEGADESLLSVIESICGDGLTAGEVDALVNQLTRVCDMIAGERG